MKIRELKDNFSAQLISKEEFIRKFYEIHSVLFQYVDSMSDTDVKKIEITNEGVFFWINHREVQLPGDGLKLFIPRQDERVTPIEIFNFNTYEQEDFKMLMSLIGPRDGVLDIGGNIGFHSLNISKKYPDAKIHCFEPIPTTYSILQKNLSNNPCPHVEIHNFGFSDKKGEAEFYYYPEGSGNASLANLSEREGVVKVLSQLSTVDDFVGENSFNVHFIKCDVEGAELFVFKGASEVLLKQRPIVFSEILRKWSRKFNYEPNEIFSLFNKADYQSFTVKNGRLHPFSQMDEKTVETNFFFIPKEKIDHLAHLMA